MSDETGLNAHLGIRDRTVDEGRADGATVAEPMGTFTGIR